MLGKFHEISIETADIAASVAFYERLGFSHCGTTDTWQHPYGVLTDGKLFAQVKDKPVPQELGDAGVTSWAQAFLKFALSHPAVTAVIPATGKPDRQTDNLRAGTGPDLTAAQRDALIAAVA